MSNPRFIPAPDQGDAQLVVLGVEVFEKATVVVFVTTLQDEAVVAGLFEYERSEVMVEDGVGTDYRRAFQVSYFNEADERRWSESHGVHRINLEFEPAVPADAGYLRVRMGRWGTIRVAIPR